MTNQRDGIAKITWDDPDTVQHHEFVLVEGATASIGRSAGNDICIPERHVSRQHAVISFRSGVFVLSDLGSANGTFLNDQRVSDASPMISGDVIRLYVPLLNFSAVVTAEEEEEARKTGTIIVPKRNDDIARLLVTTGLQEGAEFVLAQEILTVGRAVQGAAWDIALQDRAVSRPHCRFNKQGIAWTLTDLGSANGTFLNGHTITADPVSLKDGDVLCMGETTLLFRAPELPQTTKLSSTDS